SIAPASRTPPSARRSPPAPKKAAAQSSPAPSARSQPDHCSKSERCSAAKLELLYDVVRTLGKRNRIIEAQRTKRRRPDHADTNGGANDDPRIKQATQTTCTRWNRILAVDWRNK